MALGVGSALGLGLGLELGFGLEPQARPEAPMHGPSTRPDDNDGHDAVHHAHLRRVSARAAATATATATAGLRGCGCATSTVPSVSSSRHSVSRSVPKSSSRSLMAEGLPAPALHCAARAGCMAHGQRPASTRGRLPSSRAPGARWCAPCEGGKRRTISFYQYCSGKHGTLSIDNDLCGALSPMYGPWHAPRCVGQHTPPSCEGRKRRKEGAGSIIGHGQTHRTD